MHVKRESDTKFNQLLAGLRAGSKAVSLHLLDLLGDAQTVLRREDLTALTQLLQDEVGHVAAGQRDVLDARPDDVTLDL